MTSTCHAAFLQTAKPLVQEAQHDELASDDLGLSTEGHALPIETARLVRSHLKVWTETLCVDRGTGLAADYRDLVAPVIALRFVYEGFSVAAGDPRDRVFCGGSRGRMEPRARDRAAESRARMVLEGFGAIELELLEGYAAPPGSTAQIGRAHV